MNRAQEVLLHILEYQRLCSKGSASQPLKEAAAKLAPIVEEFWRQSAELHSWSRPGWKADDEYPGYIRIPLAEPSAAVICMPFHLAPANPDLAILQEILALASKIVIGKVAGRPATICLSGSTLILKDVINVSDLDFCEYIPATIPPSALARVLEAQIRNNDLRHCAAYFRVKTLGGKHNELYFVSMIPPAAFTPEQMGKIVKLFEQSQNGQLFHLTETSFAGITEATNWLIIHHEPLEMDPVLALSFAHQEAALGIYGRRPLHTLEAIAIYVNFLRSEIQKNAATNPVKAYKRAISWLRLFGAGELLNQLNELAHRHQATPAAAILSKRLVHEKYSRSADPNPPLQDLVTRLGKEIQQSTQTLVGNAPDETAALEQLIAEFGTACEASAHQESLWDQVLSLADPRHLK